MRILGIRPGPRGGRGDDRFLLELRLDEGPLGEEEATRRLLAWWGERGGSSTGVSADFPQMRVGRWMTSQACPRSRRLARPASVTLKLPGPVCLGTMTPSCCRAAETRGGGLVMHQYELMVILDPEIDERTVAPSLDKFLNVVRNDGGTIDNVDIWGRRRLAYEINKKTEGIYAVVNFTATRTPRSSSTAS